ncbi:Protein of unknown function [Sphingomonas gellani]|uniref:DUF3833 family protein n=1 Tax=Sphingomonas gellani TaxID=1166340 RepID=A0A1H8HNK3_9SPHN|nr:Protein of unknown function [Sphingomonas gellani]
MCLSPHHPGRRHRPTRRHRCFDPIQFFSGTTEGQARLKIMFRRGRAVQVRGVGRQDAEGTLILDQRVAQQGRPATMRQWRIRQVAPGRYAGRLSDAAGPVVGEAEGDRLHLAYAAKGGVRIDQWLVLSPDGRSARNHLAARKLGLVVARLDEVIRKVD